jgi:hypothetical protein
MKKSLLIALLFLPMSIFAQSQVAKPDTYVCTPLGEPSSACLRMATYINQHNIVELSNWARSDSPELRLCGGIGLFIIKKKGGNVSSRPTANLEIISRKDGQQDLCFGCDLENFDVSGLMSSESIDAICEFLVEKGYLNL